MNDFPIKIELYQGSALSPYLFAMVMNDRPVLGARVIRPAAQGLKFYLYITFFTRVLVFR